MDRDVNGRDVDGVAIELWCDRCAEVCLHVLTTEGTEAVCSACTRVRPGPVWSSW